MNAKIVTAATLLVAACSSGALTVGTDNNHSAGPTSSPGAGSVGTTPSAADASSNDASSIDASASPTEAGGGWVGDGSTAPPPSEAGVIDPNCNPGPGPATYPIPGDAACFVDQDFLNACTANATCAPYLAHGAKCEVCVQTVDSNGKPVRWSAIFSAYTNRCSCWGPTVLPPGTNVTCLPPANDGQTFASANAICARTPDCKACLHHMGDPSNPATWEWIAQTNASVCPCPPAS